MITNEQLQAVRDKIYTGWTQHAGSRDPNGQIADPESPKASCWCLWGAGLAANVDTVSLSESLGFSTESDMIRWNDEPGRAQEQVLERIDHALAS